MISMIIFSMGSEGGGAFEEKKCQVKKKKKEKRGYKYKLDGVGTVDNRPSID